MRYSRRYKLKNKSNLWDLVKDIKIKGQKNVKRVLKDIYIRDISNIDVNSEEYKKEFEIIKTIYPNSIGIDKQAKIFTAHNNIIKEYSRASVS
jgi:hypothetical protein